MGHQEQDMDVESLQKSGRRRGSCLDIFLVVSIMFLFVAVAAVAAGGVMVVEELRSKLESPHPVECLHPPAESHTSELIGGTPAPAYKMQNFAYLDAQSSELKTSTMPWTQVSYSAGKSVGSNFVFNEEQHSLTPVKAGTYFIYIELNLTCTYTCNKGLLSVRVGDKLTCEVELPDMADTTPVSKKCWMVSQLDGQRLLTQMTVPKEGLENWRLELSGSRLGMFLVD